MNPLFFLSTTVNSELAGHIKNSDMEVDSNWDLVDPYGNMGSHYITSSFYVPGSGVASRKFDAFGFGVGIEGDTYSLNANQQYLYTLNIYPDPAEQYVVEYMGEDTLVKWGEDQGFEVFSGNILTVGLEAGAYQYSDFLSAYADAASGDMIQLYPDGWSITGSTNETETFFDIYPGSSFIIGKNIIVRGMSNQVWPQIACRKTKIRNQSSIDVYKAGNFIFSGSFENMVFENVYLTYGEDQSAKSLIDTSSCTAQSNIHFNKCLLDAGFQGGLIDLEYYLGNLYIKNSLLRPGSIISPGGQWLVYRLGYNTASSTISFKKNNHWFNNFKCSECLRNPDPLDWTGNNSFDYGYLWGERWINLNSLLVTESEGFDRKCNLKIHDGTGAVFYDADHILPTGTWSLLDVSYIESAGGSNAKIQITHTESPADALNAPYYKRSYYVDDIKIYAVASETMQIYPNRDYKRSKEVIRRQHRTKAGGLFSYKWGEFDKFEFTLDYLAGNKAQRLNDWWQSSSDLLFMVHSGGLKEVSSVNFDLKEHPFTAMKKPYDNYYHGKIKLTGY